MSFPARKMQPILLLLDVFETSRLIFQQAYPYLKKKKLYTGFFKKTAFFLETKALSRKQSFQESKTLSGK